MENCNEKEQLTLSSVNIWRGDKLLIKEANLSIGDGEKIALIGRNGSGKSTLLESIFALSSGALLDDSINIEGEIKISHEVKVEYLAQDVRLEFNGTVQEYIDSQVGIKAEIYKKYKEITEGQELGKTESKDLKILELMEQYSLWLYPQEMERILDGLKIPANFLDRDIKTLSGGEATKIALASLLISSPRLILLDEPTNNLDLDNIRFLEDWFRKTKTSLLVVSHDRAFLDNVINTIWEIDEETKELIRYGGDYSFYELEKQRQFEGKVRQYESQEKSKKKLEKDIVRLNKTAKSFEEFSNDDFFRAKGSRIAKTAKVRGRRVEKQLNKLDRPLKPQLPNFTVEDPNIKKGNILNVKNLSFGYNEKPIFSDIDYKINAGERICITGPNGVGKSTLIKLFIKEISNNEVSLVKDLKISYLPQTIIPEDPSQNILSYIGEHLSLDEKSLSVILGRVLFTNPLFLSVGDFSIGELKRIQLATAFSYKPDLLILDEPTNHLDIYTLNMLERSLKKYKGALIVVSHDREFVKRINIEKEIHIQENEVGYSDIV